VSGWEENTGGLNSSPKQVCKKKTTSASWNEPGDDPRISDPCRLIEAVMVESKPEG